MRNLFSKLAFLVSITLLTSFLTGCTVIFQKGRRVDVEKISKLQGDLSNVQSELSEMEKAKRQLEDRLKNELNDKEVKVEMLERGLVITFVAEVLFDSGKADLRNDSLGKLSKVAGVLQTTVKDLNVGIEGHTDDEPIKRSGWKSNWELSSARALSVVHFLINDENLNPKRLSGTGYGEFHPVADNGSKEGRAKNRRVEIVILPEAAKEGR